MNTCVDAVRGEEEQRGLSEVAVSPMRPHGRADEDSSPQTLPGLGHQRVLPALATLTLAPQLVST